MSREKVGNLGGKNIIPAGTYKLKCCDFQVKVAPAGLYVVVDLMVVGPEHQKALFGLHTEIGFSMVGAATKPWLLAMGMSEKDDVELDEKDELEAILRTHCKGRIVFAEVEKTKNAAGYTNNTVEKPWANISPSELSGSDYRGDKTEEIPF